MTDTEVVCDWAWKWGAGAGLPAPGLRVRVTLRLPSVATGAPFDAEDFPRFASQISND